MRQVFNRMLAMNTAETPVNKVWIAAQVNSCFQKTGFQKPTDRKEDAENKRQRCGPARLVWVVKISKVPKALLL